MMISLLIDTFAGIILWWIYFSLVIFS